MLLIGMLVLALEPMTFQAHYKLDPIPADSEFFLQMPCSFTRDEAGRHYMLDSSAKTLFIWDKDGKFLQTLGRPGRGPGEFELPTVRARVRVFENRIYVADSRRRVIHIFEDFEYLKTISVRYGNPRKLELTTDGNLVIEFYDYDRDGSKTEVWLLDPDLKKIAKLAETPDHSWEKNSKGGWTFRYFAGEYMFYTHPDLSRIYVGHTEQSEIQVFSNDGQLVETIRFHYTRDPLTEELKEYYRPSLLQDPRNQVIYPDYLPYHLAIFVSGSHILTMNIVGTSQALKGYVLNKGNVVGVYQEELGDGGAMFAAYPYLARMRVDEIGDYEISIGEIKAAGEPGL